MDALQKSLPLTIAEGTIIRFLNQRISLMRFIYTNRIMTHVQLIRKRSNNEIVGIAASWLDARLFMKDAGLSFSENYIQRYKITKYE